MKSTTQKAWLLGLLIATTAECAVQSQKILTFDALPSGAAFSSYTEDGITFAGTDSATVFSTVSNIQNSSTAVEISTLGVAEYIVSMGGRSFSLRSFNVVAAPFRFAS